MPQEPLSFYEAGLQELLQTINQWEKLIWQRYYGGRAPWRVRRKIAGFLAPIREEIQASRGRESLASTDSQRIHLPSLQVRWQHTQAQAEAWLQMDLGHRARIASREDFQGQV
jgi:hypothetical protein